jgi:hypothetical protein
MESTRRAERWGLTREKLFDAIGMEVSMENVPTDGNGLDFIGHNFAVNNALILLLLDDKDCAVAMADPLNGELMETILRRLKVSVVFTWMTSFQRVKQY